ncbi:hypothetical protein PVAP13_3NG140942 [Panicum virgatum]|uniref:DUF4220 domain-containing protein n=2 Tax=Panicum virgatum TaxID=38727 RepID=A0A8T0UAI3_PANVG|nr:hypothetical protein PVAP13_3NG140942 [Panicum virgatum]
MTADVVAIFVLGHLAVHASAPRHQLMYFWAPFVLVHMGGQDTITAFSKQDNELWTRHLLSVVTQVAVAGYVVGKASWPDRRLRAAMVIMFLSGFFKYAERTWCLYLASPARLRSSTLHRLSMCLGTLEMVHGKGLVIGGVCYPVTDDARGDMSQILDVMLTGNIGAARKVYRGTNRPNTPVDISSVDVPLNEVDCILAADHLPDLLHQKFMSNPNRCRAYEYVGARLVYCYQYLYTKHPLRELLCNNYRRVTSIFRWPARTRRYIYWTLKSCQGILLLLYPLFHYVSTPVALVLFMAAEKGDRLHTSKTDIIVTYILLLGAIVLDVSSATIFIFSYVMRFHNLPTRMLLVANYISSTLLTRKQWCEELGQYGMIKRHVAQDTLRRPPARMASIRRWIGSRFLGARFLDITRIPITKDHKEFILDSPLCFGIAKQWNCTSSRGQLALQKCHQDHPDCALSRSTRSSVDFPTSVLIWHVATEMCYHLEDNCSTSSDVRKKKEMSRELSNYVMYLIFNCRVMLTSNSQLIHDRFHFKIRVILFRARMSRKQVTPFGEEEAVKVIFEANKQEEIQDSEVQTPKDEEEPSAGKDSPPEYPKQKLPQSIEEASPADEDPEQKLPQSVEEALYTPVLPHAREVAQELININDGTVRWDIIAGVWSEMLYYTAVRCGGDFHYKHLSTGGEFVTHILVLMLFLGPFQPTPGSLAP